MSVKVNDRGLVELEYDVDIQDGKVSGFPRETFERESRGLEGKFTLKFIRKKNKRSFRQNNVQWWYYAEIARISGYTPHYIKSWTQKLFLSREKINEATGEVYLDVLDTSELNTTEHNNYMEDLREWAHSFWELHLPEPNSGE